ncbi:ribonuclease H1/H2 small subunit [Coniella lustricola]|uniref:Ribonuclease H1/H2 small subunit n=1 Tax=Coniella lustricola TaxID=2025994 RepID=A0A2T3ABP6_9PEZI|nr:ribonuclease H1/H2 small subunit [Coniella lustricola]
MEQPILTVNQAPDTTLSKVTAHLLPCRVHHDGPVGSVAASYWLPQTDSAGKKTVYFRGRELHGKALKVPKGYRGVIVEKQQTQQPQSVNRAEVEPVVVDAEDEDVPLGTLETKAEFDEAVVWGHETIADSSSDPYLRAADEWIDLAEQVRNTSSDD